MDLITDNLPLIKACNNQAIQLRFSLAQLRKKGINFDYMRYHVVLVQLISDMESLIDGCTYGYKKR